MKEVFQIIGGLMISLTGGIIGSVVVMFLFWNLVYLINKYKLLAVFVRGCQSKAVTILVMLIKIIVNNPPASWGAS